MFPTTGAAEDPAMELDDVRRQLDELVELRLAGLLGPMTQLRYERLIERERVLLDRSHLSDRPRLRR